MMPTHNTTWIQSYFIWPIPTIAANIFQSFTHAEVENRARLADDLSLASLFSHGSLLAELKGSVIDVRRPNLDWSLLGS